LTQIELDGVVITETLGASSLVIVIVLTLGGQVPLLIVQVKVVVPIGRLLMPLLAELALLNVTPAALLVHVPEPTLGTLPDKLEVVPQIVWSLPAIDTLGLASLVIVTVLSLGGQVPLVIVHLNTYVPATVKPLAVAVFKLVLLKATFAPLGELTTLHTPVPVVGRFAPKVKVLSQVLAFSPAFEAVGASSRVILTSLMLGVQVPLLIVQRSTFVPIPKPVICVLL
jgi:hypothetical protein